MKEAFRVTTWDPDDAMLQVRYEGDGATRLVQLPEDEDPDVFSDFWAECTDDMLAAGFFWEPYDADDAPAVWRGDGPKPKFWTVMRVRPAETMPDWMERTP